MSKTTEQLVILADRESGFRIR